MAKDVSSSTAWARFRFAVVGHLLSAPPARGMLRPALETLAAKTWTHPRSGRDVQFASTTIERWYYLARNQKLDPVGVLRRAVRKDHGKVALPTAVAEQLARQYHQYPHWSVKLHYDNLAALVKVTPSLGSLPSYSTVRRYMQAHALLRKPRTHPNRPGEARAAQRRQSREIRSYETEYVGSLWHLDFHHGSLKVLTSRGEWQRPLVLGILDDHSRLCCHAQWYLSETAEDLVHGLSQAFQKRGLPRALMTDNGAAMVADVHYARWDLSRVDLVDPRHGTLLAALYPLDRAGNADGRRPVVEPTRPDAPVAESVSAGELPPLLKKLLADYSATGLPPAYLPQKPPSQKPQGETS
jgi:putative transposase